MGFLNEFKAFAMKGNAVDMAVGIIIGAAFNKIVTSLVNDVFMPPLGMLIGKVDFKDLKVVLQAGVTEVKDTAGNVVTPAVSEVAMRYGLFVNEVINFLIVALTVFVVIKVMTRAMAGRSGEAKPAA